ncbi:DUF3124 domain-containing protein [Lewinella cohaerens]|uniref:DUF3124 domain-containing protein n=1 Tax=Lewinella cohaerens TaxID=70995 RepID=UPI00037EB9DC|nr:DUF3124 domain-containing protein [Lewinella cohaerens]
MNKILQLLLLATLCSSCIDEQAISSISPVNWETRKAGAVILDSLEHGMTYLSVYSQIYSQTEHTTHNLTATVSMRNTSLKDTVYLSQAAYYDTQGTFLRSYFDGTIFIAPMETVEIVIDEIDKDGGTGANFIFDWHIRYKAHEPIFEAVMISTSGQQGLSFSTQGKRVE